MSRHIRPARYWQHPRDPIRVIADDAIPALRRALTKVLASARRSFDTAQAARLIAAGRYREVTGIIDWRHNEEAMRAPMVSLGDLYLSGGSLAARKLNGSFTSRRRPVRFAKDAADLFAFDRFDPETQAKIRALQDALITELGDESRDAIEQTILNGLRLGLSVDQIAAEVRLVIGLTKQQAQAVINFREAMRILDGPNLLARALLTGADRAMVQRAVANDEKLTSEEVDAATERYAAAYLAYRAETIATTEVTRASSLGLQEGYLQAVRRGVLPVHAVHQFWKVSLDERTCQHCLSVVDMNPLGVPLGEPFDSDQGPVDCPGLHPNCRCSLEMVVNLDLVPTWDGSLT